MCGIAGISGVRNGAEGERMLAGMLAALARRGPDAEGTEIWDQTILGHRRLSIFDLSTAGRQPMFTADHKIGVVFNGAIYNFRELRPELEAQGCRFKSDCDTEVLVEGYRVWGIEKLLAKIRGMYAFGIWDDPQQRLYLVRDRLGVKPLVYTQANGSIAFASTVRALRQGGLVSEIDEQAVAEYLEFGFVTDNRSIYRNVRKVAGGTVVEWHRGEVKEWEYWRPPATDSSGVKTFEDAVCETERLFLRAVELRLNADVPVGSLLSSGVDSSLVCWAIAKLGGDITAFTIATPGDPMDESADAAATARELKLPHKIIPLTPEDTADVSEMVDAYPEPFAAASALGMLRLSQVIRPSATVLLTGDGGDDVFLGYPEHRYFQMAGQVAQHLPRAARPVWRATRRFIPRIGLLRRAANFLDFAVGGLGAALSARTGYPFYQQKGLLGERLQSVQVLQRTLPWSEDLGRNLLTEFLAYDRNLRFTGEYLPKVDGGTMYYALEARSPFLDHHVWEFASSLPYEIRLRGGELKAVLRELARRHIGSRVANASKRGFSIPVQRWLAGKWKQHFQELFHDSLLDQQGWIRSAAVLRELDSAETQVPIQLWYLYVLENWMRREQSGTPEPEPVCGVSSNASSTRY